MGDRTAVLVRMPASLKARLEKLAIAGKMKRGIAWSMNDEIVARLEASTKGRPERG